MAQETLTQTDYRNCNVNYVDPDNNEILTYNAILTSEDTAVFSDPKCPGKVEVTSVKPTDETGTYMYDGLTVMFKWSGSLEQFADKLRSMSAFDYVAYILAPSYDVPDVMPI
ncbi:hypothetical protein ACFSVM_20220 [Paenibacillus shunpengii]|uniref:Uncharacterized protein n=1 Tax=Paenibacillus shunpengii TaxID=2054424 RepID=A0ABW5STX3_9BACL